MTTYTRGYTTWHANDTVVWITGNEGTGTRIVKAGPHTFGSYKWDRATPDEAKAAAPEYADAIDAADCRPGNYCRYHDLKADEISVSRAAELLGVSRQRVDQLISEDRLPTRTVGNSRMLRVTDLDLVRERRRTGRPRLVSSTALRDGSKPRSGSGKSVPPTD